MPVDDPVIRLTLFERLGNRLAGMNRGGVKKGYPGMLLLDEHDDFGTAFDNPLCAFVVQLIDNPQVFLARAVEHFAQTQFLIDCSMDDGAVLIRGDQHVDAFLLQAALVKVLLHRKFVPSNPTVSISACWI